MSTTQTQEIFDSLIVKTKLENAKCFFNNCKALAEIDVKHTISDNHKNKAEGRIKAYNKAIKQVDQILKEFTN